MSEGPVRVVPADDAHWPDVDTVLGHRGDSAQCWCQWFKLSRSQYTETSAAARKARLREQVASAPAPGVLAYLGDEPVGWCAVEPRSQYPVLARSRIARAAGETDDRGRWAVTCFVVRMEFRGRGVARALLRGAVEHARENGARVVDGYPVDPTVRPSLSSAEKYHGTVTLFAWAGFAIIARPSPTRAIMRVEFGE
jgi:ribosomal protein S18 acetylase RimI-like enzyme